MKKIVISLILLSFFLSGCTNRKIEQIDTEHIEELSTLDNSLDKYSSIVNKSIVIEPEENELESLPEMIMGYNEVLFLNRNLFEDYKLCNDEVIIVDSYGQENRLHFDGSVFTKIGAALDFEGFWGMLTSKVEDEFVYSLSKYNLSGEVLETIELPFLNRTTFSSHFSFASDKEGLIHLVDYSLQDGKIIYYVLGKDGDLVNEFEINEERCFCFVPLSDGRVSFAVGTQSFTEEPEDYDIVSYNSQKDCLDTLFTFSSQFGFWDFNIIDKDNLIYGGTEGIYICDREFNFKEELYLWENHDILVSMVDSVFMDKNGQISVLYENSSGYHYDVLVPTTEYREVQNIDFAVNKYNRSKYADAIHRFNESHPSIHIKMTNVEDTNLLFSQIAAGTGPVLIDADLVGFRENENLWEPIGDIFSDNNVSDELNNAAIKLGSINGKLYGIVTDFAIECLITKSPIINWTYSDFVSAVKESDCTIAVKGYGAPYLATYLFDHGYENSFFVKDGKVTFDSAEFSELMSLIKEKEDVEADENNSLLKQDFCDSLLLYNPVDLMKYRVNYGKDATIVGFPGRDGDVSLLHALSMVAVRRNASKEEKEIAIGFIQQLLSYESQSEMVKDISSGMSVRKDVLEEQIDGVTADKVEASLNVSGFIFDEDIDKEANGQKLYDLIENSIPCSFDFDEYKNILYEEFSAYFSDGITLDMMIDHLTSRVGIYLREHE